MKGAWHGVTCNPDEVPGCQDDRQEEKPLDRLPRQEECGNEPKEPNEPNDWKGLRGRLPNAKGSKGPALKIKSFKGYGINLKIIKKTPQTVLVMLCRSQT